VNLALGLCEGGAKARRRAAIVDLDLQFGTVGSSLDLPDRGGMLALAQLDREPDIHAVSAALQAHESGLSVLPAPRHPVPLDALDASLVRAMLEALLSTHDAVVVDLPPALVDWQEPLLRRADRLFMVTDLAVTSIDCAKRILDTFREDAPDLPVEIIVGGEKKPFFAGRLHREISAALDLPLRHWLPFDPKKARLALDRGEPLFRTQPHGAWSRGIRRIAGGLE
jgi:pilus assembly protein CpaE